jgi:hypothetical protein
VARKLAESQSGERGWNFAGVTIVEADADALTIPEVIDVLYPGLSAVEAGRDVDYRSSRASVVRIYAPRSATRS